LIVGRILRPHGIKGQVEILPLTDSPARFKPGTKFLLKPPAAGRDFVLLTEIGTKKDRVVARIDGVDDRNTAETLHGCELLVPETQGDKPADAYWHHELLGCRVVTDEGRDLGLVTEIIRTGVHDIYAVGEARKFLIPATKEVVLTIDTEKKLITIKPLPGLLEL